MTGTGNAWLPYVIGANIFVTALLAYAMFVFRSGKWVATNDAHRAAEGRRIDDVRASSVSGLADIRTDIQAEHLGSRELMDKIHAMLLTHRTQLARYDERLKALERGR